MKEVEGVKVTILGEELLKKDFVLNSSVDMISWKVWISIGGRGLDMLFIH